MRHSIRTLLALFVFLLTLFSCSSKEKTIKDFSKEVDAVEQNGASYSQQDWENAEQAYDHFVSDLEKYEGELTEEDYEEIGHLTARYYKAILSSCLNEIPQILNTGEKFMNGFMEELGDDFFQLYSGDFLNILESFSDSFEKFEDELENLDQDLDDLGDEMNEAFE